MERGCRAEDFIRSGSRRCRMSNSRDSDSKTRVDGGVEMSRSVKNGVSSKYGSKYEEKGGVQRSESESDRAGQPHTAESFFTKEALPDSDWRAASKGTRSTHKGERSVEGEGS